MSTEPPATPRTQRASISQQTARSTIPRNTAVNVLDPPRFASKIHSAQEIEKLSNRKKGGLVSKCIVRPEGMPEVNVKKQSAALVYSGFDQVGRQDLKKHLMMRVTVDPDRLPNSDQIPRPVGSEDLEDDVCDSEDDMVNRCGYEQFQTEATVEIPKALSSAGDVRVGFGNADGSLLQDRLFVARCENLFLVGLVNCHGKQSVCSDLAHLVAAEFPRAVFRSSALTRDRDSARALSDAFSRVHRLAAETLDVNMTGASVTAALMDSETLWVAHVGDCRAVLGVPDHLPNAEEFHFNPMALTQDHRLGVKEEFDRIQSCGGEVRRMVKDNVYRLFLKDSEAPGLALTRLIGHRVGHLVGVSHFPSVSAMRRSDLVDGTFLILGSGALWTTMSEKASVNWISRSYDDPSSAAQSLSAEAFRRWQDSSHPGKQSLSRELMDCFGVAVLSLGPQCLTARPRSFTTCEHSMQFHRRGFSEVKSLDRASRLRHTQANGRTSTEEVARLEYEGQTAPWRRTA